MEYMGCLATWPNFLMGHCPPYSAPSVSDFMVAITHLTTLMSTANCMLLKYIDHCWKGNGRQDVLFYVAYDLR